MGAAKIITIMGSIRERMIEEYGKERVCGEINEAIRNRFGGLGSGQSQEVAFIQSFVLDEKGRAVAVREKLHEALEALKEVEEQ